jgi:hypothetical protein
VNQENPVYTEDELLQFIAVLDAAIQQQQRQQADRQLLLILPGWDNEQPESLRGVVVLGDD